MIPFLKSIAMAYSARYADMSEMCFVFPNKRSGTFFLKYLKEVRGERKGRGAHSPMVAPDIMTITDLVGLLSGRVVASRLDLLFMLFRGYRKISGKEDNPADGDLGWAEEFDAFRRWGETVLADFSDVDLHMTDPSEVFRNVKDFKSISSNFLTEEQRQVMTEYFGRRDMNTTDAFWKDFGGEGDELSPVKKSFHRLWSVLHPLYEDLNSSLEEKGLATTGGAYRKAAVRLMKEGRNALPYKKMVAVGFNALSGAECAIFSAMRDSEGYEGMDAFCDFFWDATGPVLTGVENSASKFVRTDIRHYPAPEWALPWLNKSNSRLMPRLRVVSSPSKSAQVKIAGSLLAEQRARLSSEDITGAKVAVVLPDENLLLPMLYSLPAGMGDVNLTMGYSLKMTSVVSFVSLLRRLLARVRIEVGGAAFYHKDLRLFLAHPYALLLLGASSAGNIVRALDKWHMSSLTLEGIGKYSEYAATLLDPSRLDDDPQATLAWLDNVLCDVEGKLANEDSSETDMMVNNRLEKDHVTVYRNALRRLGDILSEYSMRMRPATVFSLVDKLLAGEKVGFEGEPLTGLQVMGTLETRSVDFDYVTILSMNEKIMPRRARSRSFIPDSLRYAYGMPPSNYAESIFAYYFFRMICRAKEVTMIYDGRTGGEGGGVSRYILQLEHLFAKGNIERQDWKFRLSGNSDKDPSVMKSAEVRDMMKGLQVPGGSNFSASSLSSYRECEAKFYYKSILKLNTDPAPSEFIDAIMVGNILHDVMMNLYVPAGNRHRFLPSPIMIEKSWLQSLLEDRRLLHLLVTRAVNRLHFRLPEDELDRPLTGGAEMVGRSIITQVCNILRHDMRLAPFEILGCEIEETLRIPLSSGKTVNFRFAIDRLDRIENEEGGRQVRIVDYKTGKLEQDADDEEALFTGDYRSKQLFQLFTYAWLLGKSGSSYATDDVGVAIYHIPSLAKGLAPLPRIGGMDVISYSDYSDYFSKRMDEMLSEVLEKDRFDATDDDTRCSKCELRMLCRR